MGAETLAHVLRPLGDSFGANPDLSWDWGTPMTPLFIALTTSRRSSRRWTSSRPSWTIRGPSARSPPPTRCHDVYAMGGQPLVCLNLVGLPRDPRCRDPDEILRGGAAKVREAGAVIAGGHSVVDAEPKYGLAAIGTVHPARVRTKGGARVGDALSHQAAGYRVITTAAKRERVADEDLAAAVASMMTLNAAAARALATLGDSVHACTDITGFGLLGHADEMASQSGVGMRIDLRAVRSCPARQSTPPMEWFPVEPSAIAMPLAPMCGSKRAWAMWRNCCSSIRGHRAGFSPLSRPARWSARARHAPRQE